MQDDDIITMESRQSNGLYDQRASNLGNRVATEGTRRAATGDPPSMYHRNNPHYFSESSVETDIMGSLTVDQSFLPPSNGSTELEYSDDDFIVFPDPAQNSVLGMPVIPAEEIETSTASMIEIRQPSPNKITKKDMPPPVPPKENIQVNATTSLSKSKKAHAPPEPSQPTKPTTQTTATPAGRRAWLWNTVENEEAFIHLVEDFRRQGFPLGLATEVCTDKMEAPYRIWLVDNNSSLEQFVDQHVLRYQAEDQSVKLAQCSRWAELVETLESHALLADMMKVNANFWFIRGERVEFNLPKVDIHTACSTLRKGHTSDARLPWKMIFDNTYERIQRGAQGYRSVVVIAGARLPSSESHAEEFYRAIQVLKNIGTSVVVRLASKDTRAAQYYESLGADGSLDIHVVGDFLDHANRVFRANPWLNYTLPLHRCREMGFNPRVFGKLEQRALDKDELREFMVILFGKNVMLQAPDVHWDWPDFFQFLSEKNGAEGMHWRMATGRMESWIDMKVLNQKYGSEALRKEVPRNSNDNFIEL